MTDGTRKIVGLAALALLALGLRLGLLLALVGRGEGPRTFEHGEIAENLLAGRGFTVTFLGQTGPTSQQAPLYPALLAAVYWCLGVGSPASLLAMQLLQCGAGTALALAVVWLAWSLLPDRPTVGWVAGMGAALHPAHIYMVTHVQVAVWAALILTLLTAVVVSPRWNRSAGGAVLAGVLGGLLLLLDPILALALPILAIVLWRANGPTPSNSDCASDLRISASGPSTGARGEQVRRLTTPLRIPHSALRTLRPPLLFAAVATLVVAPWIWRNYRVHREFVFVKSTFGYAFWQGNNPASWGTDKVPKASAEELRQQHDGTLAGMDRALWEARHETLYIDDVLLKPSGYREFAGLTEPARSRLLGQRALAFLRDDPAAYVRLCVQRLQYFLLWDETNPKAANLIYRATTAAWLVLAVLGLWTLRGRWRVLGPTLAIFAAIALFHTLTITSARFRIPVEPLTFVWCAAGAVHAAAPLGKLSDLHHRWQCWRRRPAAELPL